MKLLVSPSVLLWATSTEKTCLGKGPVKGKDKVSTQEVKEIIQPTKDPYGTVEKTFHWTLTLKSNSFCFAHQKQMSRT